MVITKGLVDVHFNLIFQIINTVLVIGLFALFVYVLYLGIRTLKLAYLYLEYRCDELDLIKKGNQRNRKGVE